MNLNPAGLSRSDVSSSWEEVNPAGLSRSDVSSSWEEVTSWNGTYPTCLNGGGHEFII